MAYLHRPPDAFWRCINHRRTEGAMLPSNVLRRAVVHASSPLFRHRPPNPMPSSVSSRFAMSSATTASGGGGGGGNPSSKARLRGVVFDMDGTLTLPVIDFGAMYRTVLGDETYALLKSQSPHGGIDILNHIDAWGALEKQRAYDTIAHFEQQGLERLQIMPGAAELCEFLDSRQTRRGLITRNVKAAVELFHTRFGVKFSPALSREFRPYKPDPAPLLHICSIWNIQPNQVMMIGDSLHDDVVCGKRAGAFTCLLDQTGRYSSLGSYTDDLKPDFKVSSLAEVRSLLEANFELLP